MWDRPGSELETVSPALAGGFLYSVPPGKSPLVLFSVFHFSTGYVQGAGSLTLIAAGVSFLVVVLASSFIMIGVGVPL